MKTTAAKFKKNPQKHYRAADLGETVTINHDRYPDKIFEMTARDRNPLRQEMEVTSAPQYRGEFNMIRKAGRQIMDNRRDNEVRREHALNELTALSQDDGMDY